MTEWPAWRRRLVTFPLVLIAWAVLTLASPVLIAGAVVFDLVRGLGRRLPATRTVLFLISFIWIEMACDVSLAVWTVTMLGGRFGPWERYHRALQLWWARNLLRTARTFGGVRLSIPTETADLLSEPAIILARHTCYPDALVPIVLCTDHGGPTTTHVLMRELLLSPAIDICGERFPNYFIRRGGGGVDAKTAIIEDLSRYHGPPDHSLIIFPEGGLADEAKRRKINERLAEDDPGRHVLVGQMTDLIPPRSAGSLALFAGSPEADIVTIAHAGLSGAASMASLAATVPFTRPVTFRLERHRRADLPSEPEELERWIDERWVEMDEWVRTELADSPG